MQEEKILFTIHEKCPLIKSIKNISWRNDLSFSQGCSSFIEVKKNNDKIICKFFRSYKRHILPTYEGSYEVEQNVFEEFVNTIFNLYILEQIEPSESENEFDNSDLYDYESGPTLQIEFNEELPPSVMISPKAEWEIHYNIEKYFIPDLKIWNSKESQL